ncbi:hypothetical protein [Ereboglobus luteus]|uniref:Uncharacterized protein n=1 Tax=Ereboglobus luteus TaxID=1796921 RepID=A0A2U8E133_9BACT|nr:hypothetical protein [Ereboglobus luteus]AWI08568.1 hypothetical protein CKA38_04250 [Ereboglobus luteus]
MKKIITPLLVLGLIFAFAGADVASAQPNRRPSAQGSHHYNKRPSHSSRPAVVHRSHYSRPHGHYRYRHGYYGWPYYVTSSYPYYYGSYGYTYPGVSVSYTTYADSGAPGYALGGALAGGVLGGIIGNNSGRHNTWAGAAIGSTIGLLAGSAADNAAVRQQRAEQQAAQIEADNMLYLRRQPAVQQPSTPAPQQPRRQTAPVSTPMSQANALFGR